MNTAYSHQRGSMSIPPEPTIGSTIRVCSTDGADQACIGAPCQVIDRIGPNTFHLRRQLTAHGLLGAGTLDWVERVTSWVNVPQAQEVGP